MPGIALNEDNSHFFGSRTAEEMTETSVDQMVANYAGTDIREFYFSPNSMRTSFASDVWDPIWKGYDPTAGNDQPFLKAINPESREQARRWPHNALLLHQRGIDPYYRWINKAREIGISPWLSMRMNDVHGVDQPDHFMHSTLWRTRPDLRRVPYRFAGWNDRAFDYAQPEVRKYNLQLIQELADRYDFDGLELDWMRFGAHLKPGHEQAGSELVTDFMREARQIISRAAKKRAHKIELGARVPTRPQTARGVGLDAIRWAREGLISRIVVAPFWGTCDFDIPIELWKELLEGTNTLVLGGLELNIQAYLNAKRMFNSIETVRGGAISLLHRGADRVYLFNYMDSQTGLPDMENYYRMLQEVGNIGKMQGKPRRHLVTYPDVWAPGEPKAVVLPLDLNPKQPGEIRIYIGPRPQNQNTRVILGFEQAEFPNGQMFEVRVNGVLAQFAKPAEVKIPDTPMHLLAFLVPESALQDGYNLVEIHPAEKCRIVWAEMNIA
jgi:hypothetical protein